MSDGTVCDNCLPLVQEQQDTIKGLQETIRRQAGALGKARRVEDDVRDHAFWERGQRLFKVWQRATGHTRARWTAQRFRQCLPFLSEYEDELIVRAITGIAYDPYVTRQKNGLEEKHDGWDLLFKSSDKFERFCNKAPLAWRDTLTEHADLVEGLTL